MTIHPPRPSPLLFFLCAFLALWPVPCATPQDAKPAAPDPPLLDAQGYKDLLAGHRGKPVLVNFWATWCEPCREEYPALVEVARAYAPQGLVALGVAFDDDADINLVRRFLVRHRPGFPNYRRKMGTERELVRAVNPRWRGDLPATCLYDRDGRLVTTLIGQQKRADFEKALQESLRLPAPGNPK